MTQVTDQSIGHELCLEGLRGRGYSPAMILDIGAAQGAWTIMALRYFPDARFFLIEALEERRQDLERLKHWQKRADFEICGVGDHHAQLELGITAALDASSFAYSGAASRVVEVFTLDELFAMGRFPQPQFLKLDVQGFELRVLEGAKSVLPGADLVLLEMQFHRFAPAMPLFHESIEFMVGHGFRPYELVDVLRRPYDRAMGQCDMLFCRNDHPLLSSVRWA